jgi:hypothetical protein
MSNENATILEGTAPVCSPGFPALSAKTRGARSYREGGGMKLNLKALAFSLAILWGGCVFLAGLANMIWPGYAPRRT